jgi:predicted dinucleotide-binding enzyme
MRIGVLGSGLIGGKLGTLFARAGHQVTFSYARSMDKLEGLAAEAGNGAPGRFPSPGCQRGQRRADGGPLVTRQ